LEQNSEAEEIKNLFQEARNWFGFEQEAIRRLKNFLWQALIA
jgi:hypothetical protein